MKAQNVIIAHPQTADQLVALKAVMKALKIHFEVAKENPYDPKFVEKIQEGEKALQAGKGVTLTVDELKALCL